MLDRSVSVNQKRFLARPCEEARPDWQRIGNQIDAAFVVARACITLAVLVAKAQGGIDQGLERVKANHHRTQMQASASKNAISNFHIVGMWTFNHKARCAVKPGGIVDGIGLDRVVHDVREKLIAMRSG